MLSSEESRRLLDSFSELDNKDQTEWVEELSSRTEIRDEQDISVCILDTGANSGHPFLKPLLATEDCQSVDPSWDPADKDGHGTLIATNNGISLFIPNILICVHLRNLRIF